MPVEERLSKTTINKNYYKCIGKKDKNRGKMSTPADYKSYDSIVCLNN